MQLDIILLLLSTPRKHAVIEVNLSTDAVHLFHQMVAEVEYRIADFHGYGRDHVIVGWQQLLESPLVTVVLDEDVKATQQWETARISLSAIGVAVSKMIKDK